jgi:hypothetical protein
MKDTPGESHPSYGQATFSRWQGNVGRLYGSPLKHHQTGVFLTITRSERHHDLGHDWHFGREELIRVNFSPAQFADLLTSMNVGGGICCTVEHLKGEKMPPVPEDEEVEHERVANGFKAKVKDVRDALREHLSQLDALLDAAKVPQKHRGGIREAVSNAFRAVDDSGPFLVEQFGEATEKIMTSARQEMAAVVTTTVARLGLQKMSEMRAGIGEAVAEAAALPPAKDES